MRNYVFDLGQMKYHMTGNFLTKEMDDIYKSFGAHKSPYFYSSVIRFTRTFKPSTVKRQRLIRNQKKNYYD